MVADSFSHISGLYLPADQPEEGEGEGVGGGGGGGGKVLMLGMTSM